MLKVEKYDTKETAAKQVADHIAEAINNFKPTNTKPFVLGLPTGSSPEPVYKELVKLYQDGRVSFKNVVTFNMDEYCGLGPEDEQSYHHFMFDHFFNHIDIPQENINILDGQAEDFEKECQIYEAKIAKLAPFQIFLGGVGPQGHIAFNEAGSSRDSLTRKVRLEESTLKANSRFFNNDLTRVPTHALSVGISTVLDNSQEIIILVFGSSKSEILRKTLHSPVKEAIPSTFLREHPNCVVVCDQQAAADSDI